MVSLDWQSRKAVYNEAFFTQTCPDVADGAAVHTPEGMAPAGERLIEPFNPKRVLDCGCSTGHYIAGIRHADPAIEVAGFDLAAFAVEKCVESVKDCVFQLDLACQKLPYSDLHFDLVLAFDFLEHQDDEHLPHVMQELTRVCSGKVFCRQPLVRFVVAGADLGKPAYSRPEMKADERWKFIEAMNSMTHQQRLDLTDQHPNIITTATDPACPYHPQERGRGFWIEKFKEYGFEEAWMPEDMYVFPNNIALYSHVSMVFRRIRAPRCNQ